MSSKWVSRFHTKCEKNILTFMRINVLFSTPFFVLWDFCIIMITRLRFFFYNKKMMKILLIYTYENIEIDACVVT